MRPSGLPLWHRPVHRAGLLGPDRGATGAQPIELGRNRARLRSTIQARGGPIELTRRCRGTPLAALVPGQGQPLEPPSCRPLARHRALNRHLHDAFTRRARPACALTSLPFRCADRTERTPLRPTSSNHAHTMVILKTSVSDRLGAPGAGAVAGWADRRLYGCLNPCWSDRRVYGCLNPIGAPRPKNTNDCAWGFLPIAPKRYS